MNGTPVKKKTSVSHKIFTVIGVILCVIFGIMLIGNLTIIIKGTIDPDSPPSVIGITPLVVLSGSMSGDAPDHIEVGDLIFVGKADTDALEIGDVITFMKDGTVITHRIINVGEDENGNPLFYTKGDANNTEDKKPVTADEVVGIFKYRIPKVGDFALFLQEPMGMVIFIGIPLLAFIIYDIIRRQRSAVKENSKTAELEAELERLRKLTQNADTTQNAECKMQNADTMQNAECIMQNEENEEKTENEKNGENGENGEAKQVADPV